MTTTKDAKAAKTTTETTTREGKSGFLFTCFCGGHEGHGNAMVITGPAGAAINARSGKDRDDRIHGFVLLANDPNPGIRMFQSRKGVFAA